MFQVSTIGWIKDKSNVESFDDGEWGYSIAIKHRDHYVGRQASKIITFVHMSPTRKASFIMPGA